ncbi:MAG TPA: 7-cyano-7-deazaguanine synthase QueC [bacterium]|nr:7-cyano-7-deazaguanine synthase QueC [bacterium]
MKKKAVCLFSGGLDSTTALYAARAENEECIALTFHYGQRHSKEIECARKIAGELGLAHFLVPIELPWKGSALLDSGIAMPSGRSEHEMQKDIPVTYVPARNSIFLTLAASCAEASGVEAIYIGANALDYSGYPDCRPEYFEAAGKMLLLGTKAGVEGKALAIKAPLLRMSKKEIVLLGAKLGVPFEKTWSCYQGKERPCGECDSCVLREKGFREAGISDPLLNHETSSHR